MGELVAVPVTGDEVTGPGEGMEIHIYSIDGKNAKMIESYENPALKASMTRGIYMLKSILEKNVRYLIVSEMGGPGFRFVKNKIKMYDSGGLNEKDAINAFINNQLREITEPTHEPHHNMENK
ncbi:NifB/NifX family molybdenum-iron cluster-binding protein [Acidiplasma sp.]|uniref:NifB/NifX family molybdenum-iron cluster-binding protein n=1 Tax=Acidiplasma sp. TaxID=1872114 RepID=UPI0025905D73|nr:NifB/NifX family molybdenum-iron cluster-binding protein [Acidiplasma sp.]